MVKRPKVPAALHSELSEYAALIRALRTTDTLDLATQLARASATPAPEPEGLSADEDEGESERHPSETVSESPGEAERQEVASSKRKRKRTARASGPSMRKVRVRDTWTRWPLLAGDVHLPEWGLQDEVKLLASGLLRLGSRTHAVASPSDASEASRANEPLRDSFVDGEDDEHAVLRPATLSALTDSSAVHLSRILALLAAHVPPAEKSMQNRVRPVGWQTVLDVVGSSALVDANVVQNVHRRMESVYGPSKTHVVDRVQSASAAELRLAGVCSAYDLSFLRLSGYDPVASLPKRKRGPYKKKGSSTT